MTQTNPQELPFAAPSRQVKAHQPWLWLRLGWRDFRRAWRQSLTYGFIIVAISYGISFASYQYGGIALLFGMLSGFVVLGPLLAITLYSISDQLERQQSPSCRYCMREARRHIGNLSVYTVVVLVIFLIWARAASMVHVFFPMEADSNWQDWAIFLSIGSLIGAMFSSLIFLISAFSLPMLMDRQTDTITAAISSTNAVLSNKKTMCIWAMLIVFSVLLGFATLLIGLAVLIPVIGHATWHAYRATLDTSQWPATPKLKP